MFTPEHAAETGDVTAGFVGSAVHEGVNYVGVFHDDSDFRVMITELGAVVYIGRPADGEAVVDDHDFVMDVKFFLHKVLALLLGLVFVPYFFADFWLTKHSVFSDGVDGVGKPVSVDVVELVEADVLALGLEQAFALH